MHVATSKSADTPLSLVELPSRALGPGDVRVRVRSIGVNPVDWKMREGGPLRMAHRFVGPSGPLVVGVDFAGEVTEVGARVTELAVGQRVVGGTDFSRKQLGSYADEVVVRPDQCATLPDAVSFDHAACLPVAGVTAYRALVELGGIDRKQDARVLVLGASGGVGLFALQIARALGAKAAGVCSTRNASVVARYGGEVIDYTKGDALEQAAKLAPYDVILNAVGSEAYPNSRCTALLKPKGAVVLIVIRPADWPALALSRGVKTALGKPTRETLTPLVTWLAEGKLEALVEATYPLEAAEDAHQRSRAGKVVGKLLLRP